tara:strand:- start:35 stop:187 length:153 start_codon:yes stop_codon:yes gene_type:complete
MLQNIDINVKTEIKKITRNEFFSKIKKINKIDNRIIGISLKDIDPMSATS